MVGRKKKERELTLLALSFTLLMFVPTIRFLVDLSSKLVQNDGNVFILFLYLMLAYVVILFQFHHVDEYTKQRGKQTNFFGLLLFTGFAVYVITA